MSISRFHAEWLSLLDISGPFLSLPVLVRRFPQGLEAHDPDHFRLLRQVHDEWDEDQQGLKPDPGIHTQWIKWVLTNTLELDDVLLEGQDIPQTLKAEIEEPQNRETLRPDMVLMNPDRKKARLLIQAYPLRQKLTRVVEGKSWKASPDTRMTQLLRDTGVTLGLVTNGDQWMLVYAPKGETSGYTSWYSTIWLEEQKTLAAFRNLLGLHRFFGVADEETLEALLAESAEDQQEVTDQLGYQVRKAVEVLVQSLDKADQDYDGKLLDGVPEKVLYEASLTVMMRLVFLFCAEERELLLLGDEIYDLNYAVSTLREQLRTTADNHGEEILERRHDAWNRLLTTFRAVYAGIQHERMKLPPYGGSLFNPDRFPFLEGREPKTSWRDTPSQPLPINNRTVLHLLEALQVLQVRLPGGGPAEPRKLSFRALDIEQIGHVYEGLLDHTAVRATEPVLGLTGTRDNEPEVPLSKLEELVEKGGNALEDFLKKETGRSSVTTINKMLNAEVDDQTANRFRTACHGDESLWKRIEPFAGLVRSDTFGYPAVIVSGSVYVTAGTDRRSSGTHYTPKSLTEPIVQYTLEPLVYEGPAEGKPKTEWKLKTAAELLDLKICDMACGSGAFLVQACRYMSDRLVEAWEAVENQIDGTPKITPLGEVSVGGPTEQIIPTDAEERRAYARRIVAQRCLYGVDVNPLAAEMAKLSLWLLTLAKDKPFEFLDHAIRCGDSLVGIHDIEQLKHFSLKPDNLSTPLFKGPLDQAVNEAIRLRLKLEDMPSNTVGDVEAQEKLLKEADEKITRLRHAATRLINVEYWAETATEKRRMLTVVFNEISETTEHPEKAIRPISRISDPTNGKMLHWPLEFPEVMIRKGGFDAFIGNPPFIGNKYWKDRLPPNFQRWAEVLTDGKVGKVDVVVLFLRRAFSLMCSDAYSGLISTTTIREGASLEVGLRYLKTVGHLYRANTQRRWPGKAGVHVCVIWFSTESSRIANYVDETRVDDIPPTLTPQFQADKVHKLPNAPWGFIGCDNGKGTSLILAKGSEWWKRLSEARCPFLRPYISGEDIANGTYKEPQRFVLDCQDASLENVAKSCPVAYKFLKSVVQPERTEEDLRSHPGLFDRWWQMWNHRADYYRELRKDTTCLAMPVVAKYISVTEVPTAYTFTNKICVLQKPVPWKHVVLLSSFFEQWVIANGGTMGATTLTLSLKKCIQTFPWPSVDVENQKCFEEEYSLKLDEAIVEFGGGITNVFNKYHDSSVDAASISQMRILRSEVDDAVKSAYGLESLDLAMNFYETKQGVRYFPSESARDQILMRLFDLNHQLSGASKKERSANKKARSNKTAYSRKGNEPESPGLFDQQ